MKINIWIGILGAAGFILSSGCGTRSPRGMAAADPAPLPEYSEDGVDLSLIRWMLSLTPEERLRFAQQHVNRILKIRELNDRA